MLFYLFLQAPCTCHALCSGDVRTAVAEHAIDGTAIGTGKGGSAADEGALKSDKCAMWMAAVGRMDKC